MIKSIPEETIPGEKIRSFVHTLKDIILKKESGQSFVVDSGFEKITANYDQERYETGDGNMSFSPNGLLETELEELSRNYPEEFNLMIKRQSVRRERSPDFVPSRGATPKVSEIEE